jgi:hypothetical protein
MATRALSSAYVAMVTSLRAGAGDCDSVGTFFLETRKRPRKTRKIPRRTLAAPTSETRTRDARDVSRQGLARALAVALAFRPTR